MEKYCAVNELAKNAQIPTSAALIATMFSTRNTQLFKNDNEQSGRLNIVSRNAVRPRHYCGKKVDAKGIRAE
jgi:hypothetical protein